MSHPWISSNGNSFSNGYFHMINPDRVLKDLSFLPSYAEYTENYKTYMASLSRHIENFVYFDAGYIPSNGDTEILNPLLSFTEKNREHFSGTKAWYPYKAKCITPEPPSPESLSPNEPNWNTEKKDTDTFSLLLDRKVDIIHNFHVNLFPDEKLGKVTLRGCRKFPKSVETWLPHDWEKREELYRPEFYDILSIFPESRDLSERQILSFGAPISQNLAEDEIYLEVEILNPRSSISRDVWVESIILSMDTRNIVSRLKGKFLLGHAGIEINTDEITREEMQGLGVKKQEAL